MSEKEALLIFCDAVDAAVTQLRQNLGAPTKQEPRQSFDESKLNWQKIDNPGGKGPYERCDESPDPEFANLKRYLEEKKGKATIRGLFYWIFTNGKAIGRKVSTRGNK